MKVFAKFFCFVSILVLCFVSLSIPTAHADFLPSNLMDDAIFNNANSMNAAQINAWLNANFPNSCISPNNGFSAVDPTGYSPSGGFVYGGYVTAGQVIYDAAQAYGLNPQVLLATLQKEEGLVRGDGPYGCGALSISASVGYGCPDGGASYSYSGISLYASHGTPVTSVSGTCVNSAAKAGFSQQIIHAAWLFKFGQQRSLGNTGWDVQYSNFPETGDSWDNSDDPSSTYGGPMTQGYRARVNGGSVAYYDGYTTIDGSSVHMDTGATAALYWYTPHFSGNQSFDNIFTSWFGYIYANCSVPSTTTSAFRLYNPQHSDYLYTTDPTEACIAESRLGYYGDEPSFSITPSANGGQPLYRLAAPSGQHFYTASSAEKDSAIANAGYAYEGISFYVQTTSAANYAPVYRLYGKVPGTHYYTSSSTERDYDVNNLGYTYEGVAFYTAANTANNVPVFRLRSAAGAHFYTDSTDEMSYATSNLGFTYEGVAFWAQSNQSDLTVPVYRLLAYPLHFFTTNLSERVSLLQRGYSNEGIGFYVPPANTPGDPPVYRLYRPSDGDHLLTASATERDYVVQHNSYVYEGVAFDGFN